MERIFSRLEKEKGSPFSSEKKGELFFTFDNGIDPDPNFSGLVNAVVKIKKGKLLLQIFPQKKREKMREEKFFEELTHFQVESLVQKEGKVLWINALQAKEKALAYRINLYGKKSQSFLCMQPKQQNTFLLKSR